MSNLQFFNSNHCPPDTILEFSGTDSWHKYSKNLRRKPKGWIYRNKKIFYSNNEQGFRTKPFAEVDWQNSIVMFGCSMVYGIGLAEEDTLPIVLENILGIPVINMGIPAGAVDVACWNSLVLHENDIIPRAIIQLWSGPDRYSTLDKKEGSSLIHSYVANHGGYDYKYYWHRNSELHIRSDRALWKNKVPYYEASFMDTTAEQFRIPQMHVSDYARDDMHPGIESIKNCADRIAKYLNQHL